MTKLLLHNRLNNIIIMLSFLILIHQTHYITRGAKINDVNLRNVG